MTNSLIPNDERIRQGDVIRNVEFIERVDENDGMIRFTKINFPYAIVLSQDCDLQQDYSNRNEEKNSQDKIIISALIAPLYNAEHVYLGEHLSEIGIKCQHINKKSTDGKNLKSNQKPRYHYITFPDNTPIVDMVIDFKHYFTATIPYLEKLKCDFVYNVGCLYREDISQRFASFLSRIGLPSNPNITIRRGEEHPAERQ